MAFREMRRFKQALTDEEIETVITQGKRMVMAVHGDDGYPYCMPLNYVYENGKIYFHCALTGHKMDAILNNDKVCINIMDEGYKVEGDWAWWVRSVILFGKAKIVEDETLKLDQLTNIGLKYFPNKAQARPDAEHSLNRIHIIEITIDHKSGKLVHEK
ncbi:MAG: pyridoxamine 5'-phosphate oxidase family protein [Erysipelotrichaceae bacterium]|nr:pyridoxamine 5'-phosphate oxidase family protein [Erysipelotrichaceae bacterium]